MNTQIVTGKITRIRSDKATLVAPLTVDTPFIITLSFDPTVVSPNGASSLYYSHYKTPSEDGPPKSPGFLLDFYFPFLSLPTLTDKNMLAQDAPPYAGPYLEFESGKVVGMRDFLWENVTGWPSLQAGDNWITMDGTVFGLSCEGSNGEKWVEGRWDGGLVSA